MIGIIIFGTRGVERKLDAGRFHCPHCRRDSSYTRKRLTRFFTLYFIPVIPLGKIGELVRCDTCGSTYSPEVLRLTPSDVQYVASPWRCTQCQNVNPADYASCVSCGNPRAMDT